MSEPKVLHEWLDAFGDEWRLIDGPRPAGMGYERKSAESGWEWSPASPSPQTDLAKAIVGLVAETRRLRALHDGERTLRERDRLNNERKIASLAARVRDLEAAVRWVKDRTHTDYMGFARIERADFDIHSWKNLHPIVRELLEGDK